MYDQPDVVLRLLVAFGLTFGLGFERQLRGSPAGDRTFALIGVATAVTGALSANNAPNAVTGVGFIGAGLTFRQSIKAHEVARGVTTAASILAAAAIGAAAGEGLFLVAAAATGLVLLVLEIRYLPVLHYLDARRWQPRFRGGDEVEERPGDDPQRTGVDHG